MRYGRGFNLTFRKNMVDENYCSTPWDRREEPDEDDLFDEVYYDDLRHGSFG